MSAETGRIEEFVLAPSDPRWGDERNRDEYYRAATIGYFWSSYGFLVVAVIAAAQGARIAGFAALLMPSLIQVAVYRYCSRRGIGFVELTGAFMHGRRKWIAYGSCVPLVALFVVFTIDSEPATLLGGAVGAVVGGLLAAGGYALLARREQRRKRLADAADDNFD